MFAFVERVVVVALELELEVGRATFRGQRLVREVDSGSG